MTRADLGILGALVASAGSLAYLYSIAFGETRPHRISWGVWTLIGVLGVGSALDGGAGAGAYAAGVYLLCQALVFALSLGRFGKAGAGRYDLALGAVAVAAIVIWQVGHLPPGAAATTAVAADGVALWFTLRSAYRDPRGESLIGWALDVPAAALGVAAIAQYSYAATLYPTYLVLASSLVLAVLAVSACQGRRARRPTDIAVKREDVLFQ
ncbi:MAG TPA: hypothetical protein VGF23_25650 [Gaiellaceae bacterium]|jgi:hypothetical protein